MDYVFAFDAEQEQVLYNAAAYAFVINYTRVHDAVQIYKHTLANTTKRPESDRTREEARE